MLRRLAPLAALALVSLLACSSDPSTSSDASTDTGTPPQPDGSMLADSGGPDAATDAPPQPTDAASDSAGPFVLTSSAYMQGQMIPKIHECSNNGGMNVSMPLAWTPGPQGTQSYAIVMRDLDFQNGFIHWVIWDIPANVLSLPQDVQHVYQPATPAGAKQAPFNQSVTGFYGPCSANSVNTYELTLYAIPMATLPGLNQQSTKAQAAAAIVGAATATAKLSGES